MVSFSYTTKKDLKESVGKRLRYNETSYFGIELDPANGKNTVTGTNHPKRSWYATVTVDEDYKILKVK